MTRRVRCCSNTAALAVACACWLMRVPSATAQTSRAEVIAQEQGTKAGRLGREGPSRLERTIVFVEQSPLIAGTSGAYPWLGSIYAGTGLGVGAGYLQRVAAEARLNGVAGVNVQGSWLLKGRATIPEIAWGHLSAELHGRSATAKSLSFFGLGPSSPLATPVRYNLRPEEAGATASVQPAQWLKVSGRYQWATFRTEARASRPPGGIPGLDTDLAYHEVQADARLDWRTSPGYGTRGGFHRLTCSLFEEAHGRPYSFEALEYEAVQLVPLLREQYVLAARGLVTFTRTENSNVVPFFLAPALGGGETLRGFETRRFTDRDRLLLTGEYRWQASRYLDMTIFLDAGRVGARSRDLKLSKLETDWGFGARIHGPDFLILRSEIAKSREGWQIALSVGEEVL